LVQFVISFQLMLHMRLDPYIDRNLNWATPPRHPPPRKPAAYPSRASSMRFGAHTHARTHTITGSDDVAHTDAA